MAVRYSRDTERTFGISWDQAFRNPDEFGLVCEHVHAEHDGHDRTGT